MVLHKKQPPLFQKGGDNRAKGRNDYTLYNPTSTPLTWSSDLYVQELLNAKGRLEALEDKKQERDLRIHILTAEIQGLTESNKIFKRSSVYVARNSLGRKGGMAKDEGFLTKHER